MLIAPEPTRLHRPGILRRAWAGVVQRIGTALIERARQRPYFHLGDYMERFWVVRHNERKSNWAARIHNVRRSDEDRALHDHPWPNASLVIGGGYWEVLPGRYQQAMEQAQAQGAGVEQADATLREIHEWITKQSGDALARSTRQQLADMGVHWRGTGAFKARRARQLHRLVIPEGGQAWSLFVMGPKRREWGFQTDAGWVHHLDYFKARGKEL